jgi:hypothetical protein
VTKETTEWLVYSGSEIKFYGYRGDSLQDALSQCINKWKTMYPVSDAAWTDDVIVGRFLLSYFICCKINLYVDKHRDATISPFVPFEIL